MTTKTEPIHFELVDEVKSLSISDHQSPRTHLPIPPNQRHHKHATNKCAGVILVDPWNEDISDPRSYRILVIQQKYSSVWGLPKGHLELGEEVHAAAWRELGEETGIHLSQLLEGVDYIKVSLHVPHSSGNDCRGQGNTCQSQTKRHANHMVIKKIHFFVYVLLRKGSTLVHSTHDTKEVAAISWMNVHRWEIEQYPERFETRMLPNGQTVIVPTVHSTPTSSVGKKRLSGAQQPPRFNRTLADTSVLALQDVCSKAAHELYLHLNIVSKTYYNTKPHLMPNHGVQQSFLRNVPSKGNDVLDDDGSVHYQPPPSSHTDIIQPNNMYHSVRPRGCVNLF